MFGATDRCILTERFVKGWGLGWKQCVGGAMVLVWGPGSLVEHVRYKNWEENVSGRKSEGSLRKVVFYEKWGAALGYCWMRYVGLIWRYAW